MAPVLAVEDLAFSYPGSQRLFSDLALSVEEGEIVGVRGRSGAGKSTLLFLLGLFIAPTAGRIVIDGVEATRLTDGERSWLRAHRIGFVFQDAIMQPTLTVAENVAEGALYSGLSHSAAIERALDVLGLYGISELAERRPTQISGGEAQRAALCRALIRRPVLILADEPTGNLDPQNADAVMGGLSNAAGDGAAVVIVTHSPQIAASCDRVVELA